MVCLKGLQTIIMAAYIPGSIIKLEALTVLNKISLLMLDRESISAKEIVDIYKMILFPICEEYDKHFPSQVALPLLLSESLCKGYRQILGKISTTVELKYLWMNLLKHLLLLADKANQSHAVNYIEHVIENIKSLVLHMIQMKLLTVIVNEDGNIEASLPEKQLSISSWKAIDAFLPDLKSEITKLIIK